MGREPKNIIASDKQADYIVYLVNKQTDRQTDKWTVRQGLVPCNIFRYKFIFLDFSPRSVMFSGWVGDQDPTFEGLEAALKRYLQSAWAGCGHSSHAGTLFAEYRIKSF
jgi:hypothetical protein